MQRVTGTCAGWPVGGRAQWLLGWGSSQMGSCLLEQNHGPTASSSGPSLYNLKEAQSGLVPGLPCPVIPPSLPGSHQLSLPEQQSPSLSLGLGSWVERVVRKGPWLVGRGTACRLRLRRGLSAVLSQTVITQSTMWVLRVKTFSGCREELAGGWVSLELKVKIPYCRKDTQTARTKKGQSFL